MYNCDYGLYGSLWKLAESMDIYGKNLCLLMEMVHEEMGQWVVEPEYVGNGPNQQQNLAVIHIDSIAHDSLLSLVYREGFLPDDFNFSHFLDAFHTYFVNSYADHQMHEFIPKSDKTTCNYIILILDSRLVSFSACPSCCLPWQDGKMEKHGRILWIC